MIRHIVMWKFRPGTEEQAKEFMDKLSALYGVIPQIKAQQIGVDCTGSDKNYTAALISDFDSLEDLETYKKDPRHQAVSALCKGGRQARTDERRNPPVCLRRNHPHHLGRPERNQFLT